MASFKSLEQPMRPGLGREGRAGRMRGVVLELDVVFVCRLGVLEGFTLFSSIGYSSLLACNLFGRD